MTLNSHDKRILTWVSEDGKHAAAGIGPGPAGLGEKPGPGGCVRHYSLVNGQYAPEGALLAVSGQVATNSGGGISGGNEVRGPVTKPEATVTWKNDEQGKPDPKPGALQPHMRETVERMRAGVPELESFNVNSGYREPLSQHDPHAEGRAVDVNRINGIPVKDLGNAQGAEADKARKAAQNLEAWTRDQSRVNQVLGPNGGWEFKEGKKTDILKTDPRTQDHLDHYHINVWKGVPPKL